jgi:hypothetical protein
MFSSQWSINGLLVLPAVFARQEILVIRKMFSMGGQARE